MTEVPVTESAALFVGKTIEAIDGQFSNQIEFRFTDGTKAVLHIDCNGMGLPDVLVCTHCAVTL